MCTILSPQLSDFFSSLFPCGAHSACNVQGSPLKCESQGVLRLAACGSSFYGSVLCAFRLGLWQMLDADGWCLLMVLYMVLSDTLADRSMARRQQVCWKGCFTFKLLLGLLWLATSWFVSGGCACYLSFRFLSLGGSGNLKQEGAEGAERLHPYRQTNKECH